MLFFSLALGAFLTLTLLSINFLRLKRQESIKLIDNCLLTRYPVYFLTGRRSLFYFLNYWNDIPYYLKEHGYDIRIKALSWRDNKKRTLELTEFLFNLKEPVHLIADNSLEGEMQKLAELQIDQISSLSIVESNQKIRHLKVEHLKPKIDGIDRIYIPSKPIHGFRNRVSQIALKANNLINYPHPPVQAAAVGLGQNTKQDFMKPYLDHLISLAEKDLQC